MDLVNKTVLITGVARGIGLATAIELAQAGSDVIGVDLRIEDMEYTANMVEDRGKRFVALACDISDEQAAGEMVAKATHLSSGFDILVNNAGVLPSGPFVEKEFRVWRRTLEINLLGLMNLTHAALPHLLQKRSGHIVNMASIAGKFATEGVVAYAAAKHGVVGFSSALKAELKGTGVGVSWICPSLAKTRLTAGVAHTFLTPMVSPETVAKAVRKAIETDRAEMFIPRRMRFLVSILPTVAPRLSRWISRKSGASQGWLDAEKELVL